MDYELQDAEGFVGVLHIVHLKCFHHWLPTTLKHCDIVLSTLHELSVALADVSLCVAFVPCNFGSLPLTFES